MTKAQKVLRDFIKKESRIPTFDEIFDIYTEHVMQTSYHCYLTMEGTKNADYGLLWLEDKAMHWVKLNLGSLVCQGEISVC